jgi:hypothetical protein
MITTTINAIYKKLVKWDKKLEIHLNGEDNAYPERVERFRNNSVTAKMASTIMAQYLIGKGFGEADNIKIGKLKLIDIAEDIARDITTHKGVFIHVNFDGNLDVSDFSVIPFGHCRIGEKDSRDYNGKILVCKDWSAKYDKKNVKVLNVFNPDKKVLQYQIDKAGGIDRFQGQIFYYNMDREYYYPLSRIDPVIHDCNSEYNASIYKDNILENGFIQSTFFITRPLIDNDFIEDVRSGNDPVLFESLRKQESEKEAFKENGKKMLGAKGIGGFMHVEVDFAGEKLSDAFDIKTVKSDINPELFKFVEESATKKILMAYNNLPSGLVVSDGSMFGDSGMSLRVMKETYWENTSKERNIVETIVNDLYRLTGENKPYLFIQPLLTPKIQPDAIN